MTVDNLIRNGEMIQTDISLKYTNNQQVNEKCLAALTNRHISQNHSDTSASPKEQLSPKDKGWAGAIKAAPHTTGEGVTSMATIKSTTNAPKNTTN